MLFRPIQDPAVVTRPDDGLDTDEAGSVTVTDDVKSPAM